MAKDTNRIIAEASRKLKEQKVSKQAREDRAALITANTIGRALAAQLIPSLDRMVKNMDDSSKKIATIMDKEIRVNAPDVQVNVPPIKVPDMVIPTPKIVVKAPDVNIPEFNVPSPTVNFPQVMRTMMENVDMRNPLPVRVIGLDGKPMALGGGGSSFKSPSSSEVRTVYELRGLKSTAKATLSTDAAVTLLGGASGVFHDLVWIKFANTSSGAVTVDLLESSTVVDTYELPGQDTRGINMTAAYPQNEANNSWTLQFNDSDITNTTIEVTALFQNES